MHVYINIYIYVCVFVCVGVFVYIKRDSIDLVHMTLEKHFVSQNISCVRDDVYKCCIMFEESNPSVLIRVGITQQAIAE